MLEERLWEEFFTDGQQALRAGEPSTAVEHFKAAADLSRNFDASDGRMIRSLTALGLAHSMMKRFDNAQPLFKDALDLSMTVRGADHPESVSLMKHLALSYSNMRKFQDADKYLVQAITTLERSNPNSPDLPKLREQREQLIKAGTPSEHATNQKMTPETPPAALPSQPPIPIAAPRVKPIVSESGENGPLGQTLVYLPFDKTVSLIGGKYELLGYVGEGGMSSIYKARNINNDKVVAIKVLQKHHETDEKSLQRFRHEAQILSQLSHPNIVSMIDYGEATGYYFLVMDFVDGTSLSTLVETEGRLAPRRCANVLIQICNGLQHAHSKGILHRDLKPSNIMMVASARGEVVKVVDFGIAKNVSDKSLQLTQTGETVGSPLYMSPEQCRGETLDQRSDIYSLGCLAYKALTGVPPFMGKNPLDVYIKHTSVPPSPFTVSAPEAKIPKQFQQIILKALAKMPEDRIATMNEFADSVRALAAAGLV